MAVPFSLPSLPQELFHLITEHLDATDIVLCRSVSKTWHNVFVNSYFLRMVLKTRFSNAREVRKLRCEGALTGPVESTGKDEAYWVRTFDRVAARYHALKSGNPHYISKLSQHVIGPAKWPAHHYPIGHRDHAIYESTLSANCLFFLERRESAWTYDDGLLVYAAKRAKNYVLLDIQDNTKTEVPFELQGKCTRRVRLCHQVLLIEWAEDTPYHKLNETESVHRHFVTTFDVVLVSKSLPWLPKWSVVFRNEWKLHFLGLPLNHLDRFFSVHTATHYAVYIWQPNRSAWGEDTPLEVLSVWDISQHSDYRPSDDPSGQGKPELGPHVMLKASYKLLDFYGIRQRDRPGFQKLQLDEGEGMVYFHEGKGLSGSGSMFDWRNRLWKHAEHVVGIPFAGVGPCWRSEVCQRWPASDQDHPAASSLYFPSKGSSIEATQRHKGNICEDLLWTLDGAEMKGYRDCSAGINFVAGKPHQEQGEPAHWIMHIWGDDWNARVNQSAVDCMKYHTIRGDERWIIGRNQFSHEIVILHFDRRPSTCMCPSASCFREYSADTNQMPRTPRRAFVAIPVPRSSWPSALRTQLTLEHTDLTRSTVLGVTKSNLNA